MCAQGIPMRGLHPNPRKSRTQGEVAAFAPLDRAPLPRGQRECELLDGLRLVLGDEANALALGRAASSCASLPCGQRTAPRRPYRHLARHAHHVRQTQLRQTLPESRIHAVPRIGQHTVLGRTLFQQVLDLLERDGRLGGDSMSCGTRALSRRGASEAHS